MRTLLHSLVNIGYGERWVSHELTLILSADNIIALGYLRDERYQVVCADLV